MISWCFGRRSCLYVLLCLGFLLPHAGAQSEALLARLLSQEPVDGPEATAMLAAVLASSQPGDSEVLAERLGRTLEQFSQRGMTDQWQAAVDKALSAQPKSALLLRAKGQAALSQKRLAEARAALKASLAIDPSDALAQQCLIQSYVIDFRSDKALDAAKGVQGGYADWVNKEQRRLRSDLEAHPSRQWIMIFVGSLLTVLTFMVLARRLTEA